MPVKVAVLPASTPHIDSAIVAAGAEAAPLQDAQVLVWTEAGHGGFPDPLPPTVEWVQLKSAGIEPWISSGRIDAHRSWTSAVGAYSDDVAEHAVALLLGSLRQFALHARAATWLKDRTWSTVRSLRGRTIAIVGAGSIGRAAIPLLRAHGARVIAVNRTGHEVEGAERTATAAQLDSVLAEADDAILAGASTEETHHLIGAQQLAALGHDPKDGVPGVLINIARGDLVDTQALVDALNQEVIGGAGLDVLDPEPLHDGHPLWEMENVIITPHIANPKSQMDRHLGDFVEANLRRFVAGEDLRSTIDLARRY